VIRGKLKQLVFYLITHHLSLITFFMSESPKRTDEEGEVVYRRLHETTEAAEAAGKSASAAQSEVSRFAPTLKPLAVGFALLLTIVFVFGSISVRELETVENETFNLQDRLTSRIRLFLNLNAAAVSLENEARMRATGEARGELMPPFEIRLREARSRVTELLAQLERPPYSQQSNWSGLRARLAQYVELTKDLDAYSRDGFVQFRAIQEQFRVLDIDLKREREEVVRQSEAVKFRSTRKVKIWWMSAIVIALLVIAATIWEVQRRFRHEQQSLDEARRERQFSTQMLEGMVSAVAAIDARSRIRSANMAFFEIFPQASIGASVYDKFATPDAMKMLEAAVAEHVTSAAYRGRWILEDNPPGAQKTFDIYSSPLEMDKEMGQIVTLVDVSEAVEAEAVFRRTEALAAVGQASAQVAHEIKNPLGSIRLGVSMLRDMTNDNEAITTIDLVERGIDHLNKLVVDVTQFSRQKDLTLTEFDLNEAVAASLDLVTDRIRDKHTPIKKLFSPEPLQGKWDEDQLLQVFVNLIANAIDAAPANSPVTITTERVMSDLRNHTDGQDNGAADSISSIKQPAARITFRDEGSGMDNATLAQIFEPFFTTKKRGTGLGLAIVKQIVEKHGGSITVHSAPDKGTSFIVDLPLKTSEK
jgi:signal transduction histidine kinase